MLNRLSRLRELIEDNTAILITSDENRFYFSGFKSSAGAVVVTKNTATLLVDFRYYEAAFKTVNSYIGIVCYKKIIDSINEVLNKESIDKIVLEDDHITVNEYDFYSNNLRADILSGFSLSQKILELRSVKSKIEIKYINEAQSIAEKSFIDLLNIVKAGVSEKDLAIELEYLMRKNGADGISFDTIVVSGKNSSLPHGVPTDKFVTAGDFITFDFGAVVNGYHSDMTRTVAVGYATDKMKEIYQVVLDSHNNAAKITKAGVLCSDVDIAARDYICSKGYGDFFGHSTGHGVGLEIHEKPTIYKTNESLLKSDMIITIEPGIYIPDEFGVRIEDMYLVTDNGCDDLASLSKELIIL